MPSYNSGMLVLNCTVDKLIDESVFTQLILSSLELLNIESLTHALVDSNTFYLSTNAAAWIVPGT